jgi:chemotaxis protein histidine kinase CheA
VAAPLPTLDTPAPTAPVVLDTTRTVPCEAAPTTNPTPIQVPAKVKTTKQLKPEVLAARKQSARVVRAVNKVFRDVGPEENTEDDAEKLSSFKLEDPSDSEQSDCDDDDEECANDPIIAEPQPTEAATVVEAPAAMAEDVVPAAETAEITTPVAVAPSTPPRASADANTDAVAPPAVPSTPAPEEAERTTGEAPATPAAPQAAPKTPSRNRAGARSKCPIDVSEIITRHSV